MPIGQDSRREKNWRGKINLYSTKCIKYIGSPAVGNCSIMYPIVANNLETLFFEWRTSSSLLWYGHPPCSFSFFGSELVQAGLIDWIIDGGNFRRGGGRSWWCGTRSRWGPWSRRRRAFPGPRGSTRRAGAASSSLCRRCRSRASRTGNWRP